jgi:phospholipase/carboxylesterase
MPPMRSLLLALALMACQQSKAPPVKEESVPAPAVTVGEIQFVETKVGAVTEASPLIVAIHGLGDTPENFIELFGDAPFVAEVIAPRGPFKYGDGFAWYHPPGETSHEQMEAEIKAADAALWAAIDKRAKGRKVIVTGFSQGGVMSYAAAMLHPAQVRHAFPVAGRLPPALYPKAGGTPPAPTDALHGSEDTMIPMADGQATIKAFKAAGSKAAIHMYGGVEHDVMAMRDDLFAGITAVLAMAAP